MANKKAESEGLVEKSESLAHLRSSMLSLSKMMEAVKTMMMMTLTCMQYKLVITSSNSCCLLVSNFTRSEGGVIMVGSLVWLVTAMAIICCSLVEVM